jgi:hypothetical protein
MAQAALTVVRRHGAKATWEGKNKTRFPMFTHLWVLARCLGSSFVLDCTSRRTIVRPFTNAQLARGAQAQPGGIGDRPLSPHAR